jgi:hypothetical protein
MGDFSTLSFEKGWTWDDGIDFRDGTNGREYPALLLRRQRMADPLLNR